MSIDLIALNIIYERISDGFVVINKKNKIIAFNKSFIEILGSKYRIKKYMSIVEYLNNFGHFRSEKFMKVLNKSVENKKTIDLEYHLKNDGINKYLYFEIMPKFTRNIHTMTVIILKDISEIKKSYIKIKNQRKKIIEKEKMASLGELMSGISESLSKPVSNMHEDINLLENIISEYEKYIGNINLDNSKYKYINSNVNDKLENLDKGLSVISNCLNKLKEQTVKSIGGSSGLFKIIEVIDLVIHSTNYKIINSKCKLHNNIECDEAIEVNGDKNLLIKIINKLIFNSINSYNKINEINNEIELNVKINDEEIIFKIKDYAIEVFDQIQEKDLMKKILIEEKNEDSFSLYVAYLKIKSEFHGNMFFETERGISRNFIITIPYENK